MRSSARKVLTAVLALFIFPLAVHAALYASKDHPASYRVADWSSVGMLPPATTDLDARLLVFTGRTGRCTRTRPPGARIRPLQAQVSGFCGGTGSAA